MLLLSKVFNEKPFLFTSIKSLVQLSNDTHTPMFYPFKLDSQDILSMQLSLAKRNTMVIEFCEITLSKDEANLFIKPVIASPSCHARHYYIRHVIRHKLHIKNTRYLTLHTWHRYPHSTMSCISSLTTASDSAHLMQITTEILLTTYTRSRTVMKLS